ncbi:MAG: V-type ATPase subunit [Eubacterium sp.]
MTETSYPYAVGRIKVQETHLLDRSKWNRLWEADETEALKLLDEIGYGADAPGSHTLEDLINTELKNARELINTITPDRILTDLLLIPTDVHNIKIILKGQLQRVEVDNLLLDGGSIPLDVLKKALEHGDYTLLSESFRAPLKKLEDEENPRTISLVVDEAAYTHIMSVLSKHKNPLLQEYYQAKIDFTNILTVLRVTILKWDSYKVKPLLLKGGEIAEGVLLDSVGIPAEQLAKQLGHGSHSVLIKNLLEKYAQDHNLSEIEQKFEDASFAIIHEKRNDSFGIGPIANYLFQRFSEGKALRVMFAGKRAGVKIPLSDLGIV